MANFCSVTMCFYGEKSAVEDLHAKCQRWMNTGGKAAKLLSALNISQEGLNLRCEACIKYDWIAEEPECQIFERHNEGGNCPEKYHLVVADDDYFPENDEELLDVMEKLFKRQFTGTEEIRQFIAVYADKHPDEYISLKEFVEC